MQDAFENAVLENTALTLNPNWLTAPQPALNLVDQRVIAERNAKETLQQLCSGQSEGQSEGWNDVDFHSDDRSIFIDSDNPSVGVLGRPEMWRPIQEIYQNMNLQITVPSVDQKNNIIQGEVGDCYFMSDLSIVLGGRLSPEQFVIGNPSAGVFLARFYMSGRWRWYTLDSKLPCRQAKDGIRYYAIYAENKDATLAWKESGSQVNCRGSQV